ncbi:MAG: endolytic transglycosylase MltG [Patescibacteria group bacterium]|nr:endolytic transglycosylase MltG [Patescibacteria group bacterium]
MKQIAKLTILSLFFLFLTSLLFTWQGIYLPRNISDTENILFLIERGQSLFQISENLEKQGIIKNRSFFNLYVILKGSQAKLQAGGYSLSPRMNVPDVVEKFVSGQILQTIITIPEGFTLNQIESEIKIKFQKTALTKFLTKDFSDEFNFLESATGGMSLEGFLFPDTYYFSFEVEDKEIFRKLLTNFDKKLNSELRKEIEKQGKTIFEIIIMASLLEKEVKGLEDKKIVSGVLWKRLESSIPLQVDATITYITGKNTTRVSREETKIDSLYNTYKYLGLPLGPISNPGIQSIVAAVYPEDSEYWYYLSTPEGETIFSKNLKEHNIAKARYLK